MKTINTKGFSLVDLIVTVTVSTVLFGLAVPVTGNLITSNRISGQVNKLTGSLALTRTEAIKRNQHVVLCKSDNGTDCSRRGHWESGWIIYVDENNNRQRDEQEELILVHEKLENNIKISYSAFGSRHYVAYRPTGYTKTNGTFIICNPRTPERSKALILTKSGRVRLSNTRPNGDPLICRGRGV